MDHHRDGGIRERSGIDEINLPPVVLLSRSSEHHQSNAELVGQRGEGHSRSQG